MARLRKQLGDLIAQKKRSGTNGFRRRIKISSKLSRRRPRSRRNHR